MEFYFRGCSPKRPTLPTSGHTFGSNVEITSFPVWIYE